jgi:hypothetical protein
VREHVLVTDVVEALELAEQLPKRSVLGRRGFLLVIAGDLDSETDFVELGTAAPQAPPGVGRDPGAIEEADDPPVAMHEVVSLPPDPELPKRTGLAAFRGVENDVARARPLGAATVLGSEVRANAEG